MDDRVAVSQFSDILRSPACKWTDTDGTEGGRVNRRQLCPSAVGMGLVVGLALVGCATSGTAPTANSTNSSVSISTANSPTQSATTPSPSPSITPAAPVDPTANATARDLTLKGSGDFAGYFLSVVNRSFNDGVKLPATLIDASCKTCVGIQTALSKYEQQGWRLEGDYYHATAITPSSFAEHAATVLVDTSTGTRSLIDKSGKVVQSAPPETGHLEISLTASPTWRVSSIKVSK